MAMMVMLMVCKKFHGRIMNMVTMLVMILVMMMVVMMVMMMAMMVIMMMVCKKRVKRWIGSHGRTTNELLNAPVVANNPRAC